MVNGHDEVKRAPQPEIERAGASCESVAIIDALSGRVLADPTTIARSPWQRLVGLLGRRRLAPGEALWIESCNGVHTMGMRYAIAVWVIDADGAILRIHPSVRPWRIVPPVPRGRITIEMLPETSRSTGASAGDRVRLTVPGEVARAAP